MESCCHCSSRGDWDSQKCGLEVQYAVGRPKCLRGRKNWESCDAYKFMTTTTAG